MTNYNNAKIYKIEPICDHDENQIYIGSTNKKYLSLRMSEHISSYKKWKQGTTNKKLTCFDIFDKYGLDNVKIVLIELVNANSKNELVSKESEYIRKTKCVNKVIPNRTQKEYYKTNKDKIKEYKVQNKDKIKEYQKLYREKQKLLKLKKTI